MTLRIIGSGFGRTGTMSTKLALERLGFGPCHHMVEVMGDPDQQAHWAAYAAGEKVDWNRVFAGYQSQVDFPGASVWTETMLAFPDAKVLHTERPEQDWWASYGHTIGKFLRLRESIALPPPLVPLFETVDRILTGRVFGGHDRETVLAAYRRNNLNVRKMVPAERLLIFNPKDGWGPLCRFLGVTAPDEPFPRSNARDEFWTHFGGEPEG